MTSEASVVEISPTLYVVATPIGNLADMVPRAIEVLQTVALIAAEDTRHSRPLLKHFDIDTPLVAYHDHSNNAALERLLGHLRDGKDLALISDAGTPLVSDPGYRLVDLALREGFKVVPIPGACAVIAALSVAGLPSDRFMFEGFLPAKQHARQATLTALVRERRTMIFYEAPHRLRDSLADVLTVMGPERTVVLAREITKLFETVKRLPAAEMLEWVSADSNQQRGECVLLIAGFGGDDGIPVAVIEILDVLRGELPLKQAAALCAKITGIKKNQLYQYGIENPL
ncbi:16S rRNA (cytidine(1402)-2'-O)-methyltransferase [Zhongshania sp.]|uniref:16S rRNA (cytidine(1402)-2'-O)-methyltransferase n=1 Tax=Zhongshania sp. TaxID=1971902 RepID=UPI00260950DD|nr:16S rRNA (cytidine(1402)-2'-O)-methyltransferase [Zhongshania sp.]